MVGLRPCVPEELDFRASSGGGDERAGVRVDTAGDGFGGDVFYWAVTGYAPFNA